MTADPHCSDDMPQPPSESQERRKTWPGWQWEDHMRRALAKERFTEQQARDIRTILR
ncbi:hypothetical protein EV186_10834 [Labedaea rhizosphaerae]|uniref:Uncharacterized protein n=1 Tax=Labedaea rhizosphaerae TaxID=598644 RepID=A0A4R6RZR9_LABRH|nr:hypothetical protein EV186_10834 [Labedaea rhizosphaerae]